MYRYEQTDMFHELTGGVELLREPVLGQCRYSNQETIDFLVEYEKTGVIPDSISFPECNYEDYNVEYL